MAVDGSYMARRVRTSMLRSLKAFAGCVGGDIMPGFANLEKRADAIAQAEFDRLTAEPAGDDYEGDVGALAEAAEDEGIAFYEMMTALRQSVLNLFAMGLFHLLEQELADLCRDGAFMAPVLRSSSIDDVSDWYKDHFGCDLAELRSWPAIDELRLVANATKHAEGSAARRLKSRRSDLFKHPSLDGDTDVPFSGAPLPVRRPLGGEDLYVSAEILDHYIEAAIGFANDVAHHFDERAAEFYPR
jgi:hypothetical protein